MLIKKSNGDLVRFDPEKIRTTIRRAGADEDLADRVLQRIEVKVRDGMATRRLFAIVRKELRRESRRHGAVARARRPASGRPRRRAHRPARARRRRGGARAAGQGDGAYGGFLPRLHRRPLPIRQGRGHFF